MNPDPDKAYDERRENKAPAGHQVEEEELEPRPGDPACRECGDLAEYPVEFPQYCSMCWNGQQRRRFARRHALST